MSLYGEFFDPNGTRLYALPFAQRGLHFSHATNGGNKRATWLEVGSGLQVPALDPALASTRLDILDDGVLVWRGRLWTRERSPSMLSTQRQVTALGYAAHLHDTPYTTVKTITGGTTIEDAFATVRDECAPLLSTSDTLLEATGRTVAATTESLQYKKAAEIFEMLVRLGNSADQPLLWHVWEGQVGANERPILELRSKPTTAKYFVSLADGTRATTQESADALANRLIVRYGEDLSSFVQVDDETSQGDPPNGYGFAKAQIVDAPKLASATDAQNLGNTLLSAYRDIRPVTGQIVIPPGARVQDENGVDLRLTQVKPGDYLQFRELRIGSQTRTEYEMFISETDYAADSEGLTVTPEQPEELIARLGRLLA